MVATGGTSIMGIDISTLTDSTADQGKLAGYIASVSKAFDEMTNAATGLGATQTRINLQTSFVSSLMDTITTGISQLVDADMNEEFDETSGPTGQAAARRPGAKYRQPVEPEHPLALPLND